MPAMCKFLAVRLLFAALTLMFTRHIHIAESVCPTGTTTASETCYELYAGERRSWEDARTFCLNRGGTLLIIRNNYVFGDIYSLIQRHGYNFWIGADDQNNEGQFVWVDGSRCCGEISWIRDEPNGGRNENCVNFWDSGHGIGLNDFSCGNKIGFICEYPGFTTADAQLCRKKTNCSACSGVMAFCYLILNIYR